MRAFRKILSVAAVAGATLLGGCSDDAPQPLAPSLASGKGSAGSGSVSFLIYPNNPFTAVLGEHKISFDRDAICDPKVSSYGVTEWDKPCQVAAGPVKITAKWWTDSRGHPQVDFQPALRFNPRSNVTLYLMDKAASQDASNYRILWVTSLGVQVDESILDPSVATRVASNGYLYRRVKHFSGYTISTGRLEFGSELY
jgi:hypothetical protein